MSSKKSKTQGASAASSASSEDQSSLFWRVLKGGDYRELEELLFITSTNAETGEIVQRRQPQAQSLVNSKNAKQLTPLCFAVDNGLDDHIALLVRAGAKVNDTDGTKEKRTALHAAVSGEEDVMIQNLLRCGADLCVQDGEGRTPLHLAARMSSRNIFGFFLELEEVPLQDPLIEGVKIVHSDILRILSVQDHLGATALHYAVGEVAGGDEALQLAQQLVEFLDREASRDTTKKVRVDQTLQSKTKSGCSALHLLAASGASDKASATLVRTLVKLGCPLDSVDQDGLTALHYAASTVSKSAEVFIAIAEAMSEEERTIQRADASETTQTAFEVAVEHNNKAVVEWVCSRSCSIAKSIIPAARQDALACLAARAHASIQSVLTSSGIISKELLEQKRVTSENNDDDEQSDDEEDEEARGDYSGHGSNTFAGSRVQAARKAASQKKKETPEEKAERQALRKQVQENIQQATEKRDEDHAKSHGGLSWGAKLLIGFFMLSVILPALDLLMGSPAKPSIKQKQ